VATRIELKIVAVFFVIMLFSRTVLVERKNICRRIFRKTSNHILVIAKGIVRLFNWYTLGHTLT